VAARSFDGDGRVSALSLGPAGARQVIYDAAGRITGLNDPVNTLNNQTYGYDALDRVTSWMDSGSARAYTYDATGNRTNLAIAGNLYGFAVAANSNRLTSTDGPPPARTFSYDGAGNIVSNVSRASLAITAVI
jgi:YD repeat-containing protein